NQLGIPKREGASARARYITAVVEKGELQRVGTATGALNATVNVEVGSQLSGQIAEILVDFNDVVKKGDPLARLDQKSFKAKVAEAEAGLDIARVGEKSPRANVERAEIQARDSEAQRAVLKARTDNARVSLDAAQIAVRRKDALQSRGVGALADLEDTHSRLASASAALREAEAVETVHEHKFGEIKEF